MEMNDNTILRIKVPAHLYEAVKAQLTLNEAKKGKVNLGAGMEPVKGQKASGGSSDKPKAPKSDKPKASAAPKKEKMEVPKDGMKKATAPKKEAEATKEKKKPSIEEIKKLHKFLGGIIAEMEKSKEPVEEGKNVNEAQSSDPDADGNYRDTMFRTIYTAHNPQKGIGKKVTIDGEPIAYIEPGYRNIYYGTGDDTKKITFVGNKEKLDAMADRIQIDGQPLEKPAYFPSKPKGPEKPEGPTYWMSKPGYTD